MQSWYEWVCGYTSQTIIYIETFILKALVSFIKGKLYLSVFFPIHSDRKDLFF